MRRTGIYDRISEIVDPAEAGVGVGNQDRENRRLADTLGWSVADSYVDDDTGAYDGKPREQYQRMLDDIRNGRIDAIIAWHPDRLFRRPRELEDFIDFVNEHGVEIRTVRAGEYDLSTPAGRLMARQLGSIARYESEQKADRLILKHAQLARDGAVTGGGWRPYGYKRLYDRDERPRRIVGQRIVEEEAAVIRDCAKRVLAGEALAAVCRDLNRRGVATSTGGQWSTTTLARLLASARIAGGREHRPRSRSQTKRIVVGEVTKWDAWPAIITRGEHERLRALLVDPDRRTSPGPTGRHLGTGVLYCSRCGQRMVGRSRGAAGRRQYMCDGQPGRKGCGNMHIDAPGTDGVVAAWVAKALSSPGFRRALEGQRGPDETQLLATIADGEHELEELARDRRRMSRREWLAMRAPIDAEIQQARRVLARVDTARALDGVPADRDGLERHILDQDIEASRRRAVVFAALVKVVVRPAVKGRHRFDPDRLDPEWRA